ncbi:hypothetical protein ACO2Q9_09735 [Variovorax sp. VNK109]|uniref:hypothetical protein n=1 Tax=Variovorax sp. VNK109 TaxID=3400919 RepID=UPI003BFC5DF9
MAKNPSRGSVLTELKLLSQLDYLVPKSAARYLELILHPLKLSEKDLWDLVLDQKVHFSVETIDYQILARRGELRDRGPETDQIPREDVLEVEGDRILDFSGDRRFESLSGVFDVPTRGGWRSIASKQRDGGNVDNWDCQPVFYQRPGDPLQVWVGLAYIGEPLVLQQSADLGPQLRIGFRRAELDRFVETIGGETSVDDDDDLKQFRLTTALKILGAVLSVTTDMVRTQDKLQKQIHGLDLTGLSESNCEKYFRAANRQFAELDHDRMDANRIKNRK